MSSTVHDDVEPGSGGSDLRFSADLTRSDSGGDFETAFADALAGADRDRNGPAEADPDPFRPAKAADEQQSTDVARAATAGFAAIAEQLDRRSRESIAMVRLLEQSQQMLDVAEAEREAAYADLARTVPLVQETAQRLAAALAATRGGEPAGDLDELFTRNADALATLEKTAVALSTQFLRYRMAWEQYSRSVDSAQRLGGESGRPS